MIVQIKSNKQIELRRVGEDDAVLITEYLSQLSAETRSRFGPHPYDIDSVTAFYKKMVHLGFMAIDIDSNTIIGYAVIKMGYLEHDFNRLENYGISLDHHTDCTFAPSVADNWQNQGVGNALFDFMLDHLLFIGFSRIILWGGVQASNENAIQYYKKIGFENLGSFEYHGLNYDMILNIGGA